MLCVGGKRNTLTVNSMVNAWKYRTVNTVQGYYTGRIGIKQHGKQFLNYCSAMGQLKGSNCEVILNKKTRNACKCFPVEENKDTGLIVKVSKLKD